MLKAFLAGDLDPVAARRWDDHLLTCEKCWRAVREDRDGREAAELLRQPAPPGLADRVRFAVELATATGTTSRRRNRRRGPVRWRWLAGAGALAAGLAVTVMVRLLPGSQQRVPGAVAVVARHAEAVLSPAPLSPSAAGRQAGPVEVGHPVTLTAGRQWIVVRTWRLGRVEA